MILTRAWCVLLALLPAVAAEKERVFDFNATEPGAAPAGFVSRASGTGQPGKWEITLDEAPTAFPSVTGNSTATSKRKVLAQTARNATDEHFPLLIAEDGVYDDFTFTARVKLVEGATEQMAGLAFRIQDERNYYVARVSGLGNNFRFYKFVDGARSAPIGPELTVARGVWHELTVECKGNTVRCLFNGREVIPPLTDSSFAKGRLGFWTKSDAVSYFADARVSFRPREGAAQALVSQAMREFPRLAGIKIYARRTGSDQPAVIAGTTPDEVGKAGGTTERTVIEQGTVFYGKAGGEAVVTMPLKDRNGDPIAAVRVILKSFPGQTEANAVGRATPVVKLMESHSLTHRELFD